MDISQYRLFFGILTLEEKFRLVRINSINFLFSALDISFLGILLWLVNFYTQGIAINFSLLGRHWLFHPRSLTPLGVFTVLFYLKNFISYQFLQKRNIFFFGIACRLSSDNLIQYLSQDYLQYVGEDSSVQVRKISQEPIEFITYVLINIQEVISQSLLILFSLVGMICYKPSLFLGLFLILLPPLLLLNFYSRKKLEGLRKGIKKSSEMAIQTLREALDSYLESNVYGKKDFFHHRFIPYQNQLNRNIALQQTLQGLPVRFLEIFAVFGYFILQWIFLSRPQGVGNPILEIGIFLTAAYKIIPGMVKLMNCSSQIKTYWFTVSDLSSISKKKTETINLIRRPIHSIVFQDVDYQLGKKILLKNLNFEIRAGDFLVLSGKSGTGKSTLIRLLLGLLTLKTGKIFINQELTNHEKRKEYWPSISYIQQDPFLLQDTLKKNICLSDTEPEPEKMKRILVSSQLDTLVNELELGLNTLIMENGKNLSGGQKQRIMLARALYQDFDLLILDEALSEVDEPSSRIILNHLVKMTQSDKMVLMITHNPNHFSYGKTLISLDEP